MVLAFDPRPRRPSGLLLFHAKRPQIERTFWVLGCVILETLPISDDYETHLHVTYASHLDMDDAFCACMRSTIAAGRESAPIGVITTPGTKNPRYLATEPRPLASSQRATEYA